MLHIAALAVIKKFNLTWYEWVFIGVVVLFCTFTYITYQRLQNVEVDLLSTQGELSRSLEAVNVWRGLRESDALILNPYYEAVEKAIKRQQLREVEFVSDYIKVVRAERKLQEAEAKSAPPKVIVAEQLAVEETSTSRQNDGKVLIYVQPTPAPIPKRTPVDHSKRVGIIIDSMWDTYCDGVSDRSCVSP